jgi:hypothetical protein
LTGNLGAGTLIFLARLDIPEKGVTSFVDRSGTIILDSRARRLWTGSRRVVTASNALVKAGAKTFEREEQINDPVAKTFASECAKKAINFLID